MVRKLTLLLISAALLTPGGAFALGLGEIHLKSALNQTFDANIDLLSVKPDELDGVKVTLATPEAFERAGIDRLFILTKLRYQPDLDSEGKPVIHITSRQAIREPFLNFLIEVNWAKGRLVREYTVLLDPPVTLDRKPLPVTLPATPAGTAPVQSAPPPQTAAPRSTVPVAPAAPQIGAGVEEYGPVMANESLWKIANQTRPQGVTVEQMMMALQHRNPEAFYRQNVNNLKRGSILRMPTREEIDRLSAREARAAFSDQMTAWRASRALPSATATGSKPATEKTAAEQPAPAGKLELASVRPEGEGKGGASEGDGSEEITTRLENELLLAREQFESAKQERDELSSQVSQLESRLTDMENLLALRNEQLARLQHELEKVRVDAAAATAEAPAPAGAAAPEETAMPEPEAEAGLETAAGDEEELEIVDDTETADGQPETAGETGDEEVAIIDEGSGSESAQKAPAASPKPAPAPAPAPPATRPAESTSDLLQGLLADNMLAAAGGGLVILLLLLLLLRRRKAESDEFEESILIGSQGEDTESLGSTTDEIEASVSEAAETSFLSEFSHSDMDVLQDDTGEVDPVAEADVYIAYGRYQQAEELLRQAIERDPEQTKSYFKLLEILFVTKNVQAFTEIAETLATKKSDPADNDAWQQVLAMGHQLDPEHSLFAEGEAGTVESRLQSVMIKDETGGEADQPEQQPDEDPDLMDLSELSADPNAEEEGPISSLLEDDSLDFDLDLGLEAEQDTAADTDVDSVLQSADIGGLDADTDDALLDLSTESADDADSGLDAMTETSELEASLSLDELELGDALTDLEEKREEESPDADAGLLGDAEDLAAELSRFTDEPAAEEAAEQSDLLADTSAAEEETAQDERARSRELEQALSGFTDDLSLDEPAAESASEDDLTLETDLDLDANLDTLGDLDASLSLDDDLAEEEEAGVAASPDELPETDGLILDEAAESGLEELSASDEELADEELLMEEDSSADFLDESLSELVEEPDETDKINTKLDLARAYVEMGDDEGARSILDEVLNEGDEAQKQDAQALLGRLSQE